MPKSKSAPVKKKVVKKVVVEKAPVKKVTKKSVTVSSTQRGNHFLYTMFVLFLLSLGVYVYYFFLTN